MALIALLVALGATTFGGICGIGGGVIIKPLLDLINFAGAAEINFLSSCTILSMTFYSFVKSRFDHSHNLDKKTSIPLAVGAAIGGLGGNLAFKAIRSAVGKDSIVTGTQEALLLLLVCGTFLYTLYKKKITPHRVENPLVCGFIGVILGALSSFLGIGGFFNPVVLHFFLGQETKKAVENSLFIILLSQTANLALTLASQTVPAFEWQSLVLMIAGGVGGGIVGKWAGKKLSGERTDKLFLGMLSLIAVICAYNIAKAIMNI